MPTENILLIADIIRNEVGYWTSKGHKFDASTRMPKKFPSLNDLYNHILELKSSNKSFYVYNKKKLPIEWAITYLENQFAILAREKILSNQIAKAKEIDKKRGVKCSVNHL